MAFTTMTHSHNGTFPMALYNYGIFPLKHFYTMEFFFDYDNSIMVFSWN